MPLSLRRGRVDAVFERHAGLVRLEVGGNACVAYPQVTGDVEPGDEVLVNVQARELGLGSGGFDVLYANLTRGLELPAEEGAHVMALPYTPGQWATRFAEEEGELVADLDGLPVVCCTVHSQLAPVCAGLRGARVAYLQVAGGALPLALSDTLRALREADLVATTISAAPCFGGDAQTVTVAAALAWALASGAEAVVCAPGPGLVGTGSTLGNGALGALDAIGVVAALGGAPILAPRTSVADERERHRGVSHHTETVVRLAGSGALTVAWPRGVDPPAWLEQRTEVDADGWREACAGLPLSFMGRGPDEEPTFFAGAFGAGRLARAAVERRRG